jgi:hypothetical protein
MAINAQKCMMQFVTPFYHYTRCWLRHGTKTTTCASFNHIQLFCQQVNIVLTENGIVTLANFVITDPMKMDLLPQSCTTQVFVTFDVIQAKKKNYHN